MLRLNRLSKMIDSLKRDLHVYINIHPLEKSIPCRNDRSTDLSR